MGRGLGLGVPAPVHARAQLAINGTGAAPDPHAMLDVSSTTKGLLVPRTTAAQLAAIAAPANGLIVYQTNNPGKGLYYYDTNLLPAPGWVPLGFNGPAWVLGGNAGTNPATDFLGTTTTRTWWWPPTAPSACASPVAPTPPAAWWASEQPPPPRNWRCAAGSISGSSSGNNQGDIRFNATTNAHEGNVDNSANWYQLENVFNYQPPTQGYYTNPIPACAYASPVSNYPVIDNPSFSSTVMYGTTETPYSRGWEDGRHQYLYLASDFTALNICANTDILGIGFQATYGGGQTITNCKVSMKNTPATSLPTLDPNGLQLCYAASSFNPVAGWNMHNFGPPGTPFQWNGNWNVLVEWCEDLNDWTGNLPVNAEVTNYTAMYGIYCDACGNLFVPGSGTCYWSGSTCGGGSAPIPNTVPSPLPPPGTAQATPGILCAGWGHTGGCSLLTTSSLTTCDGTFQWQGWQNAANLRPLLKLNAQINAVVSVYANGDYIYSDDAVMVERNSGWATSGVYPNQVFKGPGTLGAEVGVWGGGVLLSDHVFDIYYDGHARPEDRERARGYQHYPIDQMVNYVEKEHHLPTIQGRDQWKKDGPFSLDDLDTQLWVTVEEQALYIKELNERMDLLRKHLVRKRLQELDADH